MSEKNTVDQRINAQVCWKHLDEFGKQSIDYYCCSFPPILQGAKRRRNSKGAVFQLIFSLFATEKKSIGNRLEVSFWWYSISFLSSYSAVRDACQLAQDTCESCTIRGEVFWANSLVLSPNSTSNRWKQQRSFKHVLSIQRVT